MSITKVWIEEGCIVCNACEAECPDVFHVTADSCHIKGDSRQDDQEDENRDVKSLLKESLQQSLEASIVAAAVACPVNVIQYTQIADQITIVTPDLVHEEERQVTSVVLPSIPEPVGPKDSSPVVANPDTLEAKPRVQKVWIEEGCIVCNACEAECPDVFHVTADSCHIKSDSRIDGKENENRLEKSDIKTILGEQLIGSIIAAAAACPVDVIKYDILGVAPDVDQAGSQMLPSSQESVSYVWDITAAPNRIVVAPKTVPMPSLLTYRKDQEALRLADEAKWQKQLSDYEINKDKALAENKEAPKAPVRPVPKKEENDVIAPIPMEATDPDLIFLKNKLGDKIDEIFQQSGELVCQVKKENILEALQLCKNDSQLSYEMLADETATHYPLGTDFKFSVVYHLTSLSRSKRLRLRILISEEDTPASAVDVYPGANWLEREIYDMLGIKFQNHPSLTRILCPDDWEGFPLRKEYPTLGLGQREIDFREDRSGVLMRIAMEKAGHLGINLKKPTAD